MRPAAYRETTRHSEPSRSGNLCVLPRTPLNENSWTRQVHQRSWSPNEGSLIRVLSTATRTQPSMPRLSMLGRRGRPISLSPFRTRHPSRFPRPSSWPLLRLFSSPAWSCVRAPQGGPRASTDHASSRLRFPFVLPKAEVS